MYDYGNRDSLKYFTGLLLFGHETELTVWGVG
jgi:hypothetical protein